MADFIDEAMGTPQRATYADLDRTPEGDGNVYELVDGTLQASPRPTGRHSVAQTRLLVTLERTLRPEGDDSRPSWEFVVEPELRLAGDALVPDIAAWRSPLPRLGRRGYFDTPPAWVCEVLSPTTTLFDWRFKLPAYLRHGVGHVWLLDLGHTALHVLGSGVSETHEGNVTVSPQPFGVAFDLGRLWTRLPTSRR